MADAHALERENERVRDLLSLLPDRVETALDVGARDGHISKFLADRLPSVTALDLEQPAIDDERIHCVRGKVTSLQFSNDAIDLVVCTEVLEHVPGDDLPTACRELARVSRRYVLIGVPYKQDTRVGRTTCRRCGKKNPPWGHLNQFDEFRLRNLFPACSVVETSYVGTSAAATNFVSTLLMDAAGNPYGTYSQDEPCVHCGGKIESPPERTLIQKVCTRLAFYAMNVQNPFIAPRPNWIHVLFEKRPA